MVDNYAKVKYPEPMTPCFVLNPKHLPYTRALTLMAELARARQKDACPEVLILTEHEPVITGGRRTQQNDIGESGQKIEAGEGGGIAVHQVDRGGLYTYHGPGQLMLYPVFSLKALGLGVAGFTGGLEEAIIATLASLGLAAGRQQGHPGVWVGDQKVASLGLAVSWGVTRHGLALNNDPDLSHFELINPCGLDPRRITSLAVLLGAPVEADRLRSLVSAHMAQVFDLELIPWNLDEAREKLTRDGDAPAQTSLAQA